MPHAIRKSLSLRFLAVIIPFLGLLFAGLFVGFSYFTSNIIDGLSERFAGQQVSYDRGRMLQPLLQEVALARTLARSPAIIDWALHEGDPDIDARGLAELESFRDSFRDGSYFFVIDKSAHYFYNDAQNAYTGRQLRYTLSADKEADSWYYATLKYPKECQLNVNNDTELSVTKVWINCLVKKDNTVIGVIGTGLELSKFIHSILTTQQAGVVNVFIDGDGAIQAHPNQSYIDFSSLTKGEAQKKTIFRLFSNPADQAAFKALLEKIKQSPDKTATTTLEIGGQKKLLGIAYLKDIDWFNITVMTPNVWALGNYFIPLASITLMGILLTLIFGALILHRIVLKRIKALDTAIGQVKGADYELELSDDSPDEIGRLTTRFVEMAKVIHKDKRELEHIVDDRTHQLQKAKECAELYLDIAGSIIIALDSNAKVTLINNQGCLVLGLEKQDIIGKNWFEHFVAEDQKEDLLTMFIKIMSGDTTSVEHLENEVIDNTGERHLISWHDSLLTDISGKPTGTLSSGRDITAQRKGDIELFAAKNDAEKANLAKTRFLAAASHDLRQPLQAANLFLYALSTKVSTPETQDIVLNIEASVQSLGKLLDSLLDISRLEAGLIEPQIQDFPITSLLERIATEYIHIVADSGDKMSINFVKTNAIVHTDPTLLETIVRNLISNAYKNSQTGKILIGCRHHDDHIIVEVWDNGCGIPEDRLTEIFGEFVQIGNEGRDSSKGLGLGLSIVEKLAKLLNHTLHVRSWEGKGSAFSIELPRAHEHRAAKPVGEIPAIATSAQAVIFVVEDEPAIRASLAMVLEQIGYKVYAISGHDVPECEQLMAKATLAPDLILADYRLQTSLTGVDIIKFFHGAYDQSIPAILLTGDTAPDRLIEAKASGFQILHKPIDPEKLTTKIEALLKATNNPTP